MKAKVRFLPPLAMRHACLGLLVPAALAACSIVPERPREVTYDLGPPPARTTLAQHPVRVPDVRMPLWMNGTAVYYRLAYRSEARLEPYTQTRWIAPPASLITDRLRERLAGTDLASGLVLQVELSEFTQTFDRPEHSVAVLRGRAILSRAGTVLDGLGLSIEKPAATADGPGGVQALTATVDSLGDQLAAWLARPRP
jgi:cholesterol transport system auxiliary component